MYTIDPARPKTEKATTSGIKFEIVTYITAADQRYIEEPVFESMEMKPKMSGEQEMSGGIKGSTIHKVQDRRFEVSLVSLDGSAEKIVERLMQLPLPTYNEIKELVAEVTGEKKAPASPETKQNT